MLDLFDGVWKAKKQREKVVMTGESTLKITKSTKKDYLMQGRRKGGELTIVARHVFSGHSSAPFAALR
jgi:hypothetical protein